MEGCVGGSGGMVQLGRSCVVAIFWSHKIARGLDGERKSTRWY